MKPYSKPFNRNIIRQKKIRRQPQEKPSFPGGRSPESEDGRPQGTLKRFLSTEITDRLHAPVVGCR
ncbi:hypothetical protein NXW09_29370 [Bacteroides ovatus]|nr:hypothetical protein [Bacteroides ovatus]